MVRAQTLRQVLIMTGLVLCSVSDGFIFGQMSGMFSALKSDDSDISLSDSDISWIASTINATCVGGFAVVALITEKFGRKRAITILTAPIIISWLMIYYAKEMTVFMISRVLVGVCFGGVISLLFVTTAEYMSPSSRGFCLNMVSSLGPSVGTFLGHILGILLHWRTVALIGIIPTALSAIIPCFWVESPSWLASKGRFKECEASFKALHGHRDGAIKELQLLLEIEKLKLNKINEQDSQLLAWNKCRNLAKQKYFWKHLMLTGTVIGLYRAAGCKILFSTFAITMLQEMTGSSNVLLFTLLVDGFVILGACMSCLLTHKMKMRSLLFSSGILANLFLLSLSAGLYFKHENDLYFPWINSTLLGLYFIVIYAGPYPVLEALYGEIFPLEVKAYCIFIVGIVNGILIFLTIKLAPDMFLLMGYHGVFLFYTMLMFACIAYLWMYLPETKGRTLQEIELYFKNDTFDNVNDLLTGEQTKVLV